MSLSDATRAVSVLAELAPSGERNGRTRHHVTDRALLPLDALRFLRMPMAEDHTAPLATGGRGREVVDMVKRSRLHGEEDDLRLGWLWITEPDRRGAPRRFPLVSARVSATTSGSSGIFSNAAFTTISVARAGDVELTELIGDDDVRCTPAASQASTGGGVA